jgi:general secretion pathway protein E/type IV pilus assembly protein PilB
LARDTDYILSLLLENGLVTRMQADQAADQAMLSEGLYDTVDILVNSGVLDEAEMTALLAQQYGMEVIELTGYDIPEEVLDKIPREIVEHYRVIPVMMHDGVLTIAMSDPSDMETIDTLRYLLKGDIDAVIAPQKQIDDAIGKHYANDMEKLNAMVKKEENLDEVVANSSTIGAAEEVGDDDAPIIRLVTSLLIDAYKLKASDIHFEPMEKRYRVRYRIDGALREVNGPPKYLQANFTSRVKIMARLDITEKRIPQDGRIQVKVGDKDVDLRVSSIPTTHGESIVMRILDKASIQLDIPKLGFYADDLEIVTKVINLPDGIFLVTGPTGSGKTTSLYAFINTINTPTRKIITVEDPVEYQLAGINQVQVDKAVGMTFAAALRAMLRQAPNIVMVGEIRDVETAEVAINAALTGHLVFSTLHTNDAPGAISRLVDMGVKPFLVATALRAVMAQRLLRRICTNCKVPYMPTPAEARLLGLTPEYLENHQFYKGKGCPKCGQTGYKGRIGIYEIFEISDEISRLIFANEPSTVIREAARRAGMRSLRDDAMRKAEAGITTLEEVLFVTLKDE